jgi:excisionase family DNA binding protein
MSQPKARRVPDACAALGIGKSTLYKLASEGKLHLVRIAGRTVVPESEIDRLAAGAVPHSVPHLVADCGGDARTTTEAKTLNR